MPFRFCILLAAFAGAVAISPASAEPPSVDLSIKGHRFQPEHLIVPQGVKVQIRVSNQDPTAEEFESTDLHREKIVPAGQTVPVLIGPLDAGDYNFFGDFHQDTAKGIITAK